MWLGLSLELGTELCPSLVLSLPLFCDPSSFSSQVSLFHIIVRHRQQGWKFRCHGSSRIESLESCYCCLSGHLTLGWRKQESVLLDEKLAEVKTDSENWRGCLSFDCFVRRGHWNSDIFLQLDTACLVLTGHLFPLRTQSGKTILPCMCPPRVLVMLVEIHRSGLKAKLLWWQFQPGFNTQLKYWNGKTHPCIPAVVLFQELFMFKKRERPKAPIQKFPCFDISGWSFMMSWSFRWDARRPGHERGRAKKRPLWQLAI